MNRLDAIPRTLLMALVCAMGIVGMLLFDGVGDVACFLLTASPLLIGGWYAWRLRASGAASRASSAGRVRRGREAA